MSRELKIYDIEAQIGDGLTYLDAPRGRITVSLSILTAHGAVVLASSKTAPYDVPILYGVRKVPSREGIFAGNGNARPYNTDDRVKINNPSIGQLNYGHLEAIVLQDVLRPFTSSGIAGLVLRIIAQNDNKFILLFVV